MGVLAAVLHCGRDHFLNSLFLSSWRTWWIWAWQMVTKPISFSVEPLWHSVLLQLLPSVSPAPGFSALCGQGLGAELRKAEYQKLQEFSFGNMDHFRVSSLITRLTRGCDDDTEFCFYRYAACLPGPFYDGAGSGTVVFLSTVLWQLFSLWPCRYWRCCFFRSSAMCVLYMRKCRGPWIW